MARITKGPLLVSLCIEDVSSCALLVSQIASGQVFGHNQRMKLIIQGTDVDRVNDLCIEIQDCAYSLVEDVSGCVSFLDTQTKPEVLLVILSTRGRCTDPTQWSPLTSLFSLVTYIRDLSLSLKHCQLEQAYVIVTGETALTAANLLAHELDSKNKPAQLIAVDGNHGTVGFTDRQEQPQNLGRIQRISSWIREWWTGCKSATKTYLGSQHFDLSKARGAHPGYFFSTPVELDGPRKFHMASTPCPDPMHVATVLAASDLAQKMADQMRDKNDCAAMAQLAKL